MQLFNQPSIGLLVLRLFIAVRLFYGVIDNVVSWERMQEFAHFLAAHHFPFPMVSAVVSVYVQLIGSLSILVGFKTRCAAILLTINFLVAIFAVHVPLGDSFEGMTPPLAMLFGCLALLFTGAGNYSLDKN